MGTLEQPVTDGTFLEILISGPKETVFATTSLFAEV